MKLKIGQRYVSQSCETEVIVVRAPGVDVEVTGAGHPMALGGGDPGGKRLTPLPEWQAGTALGKRYATRDGLIEVLVVKAGSGTLAVDGVALHVSRPKALPSSD